MHHALGIENAALTAWSRGLAFVAASAGNFALRVTQPMHIAYSNRGRPTGCPVAEQTAIVFAAVILVGHALGAVLT